MKIVDAHRDNGKRFVVPADEKLTAFVEVEAAIHAGDVIDEQVELTMRIAPDVTF
jgi:hypothetical protein